MREHLKEKGENTVIFGVDRVQGIFTQTWTPNDELTHEMQQFYPISFNKFDYEEFIKHLSPAQIKEFEEAELPHVVESYNDEGDLISEITSFKEYILAYIGLRDRIANGTATEQDMVIEYYSKSQVLYFDYHTEF